MATPKVQSTSCHVEPWDLVRSFNVALGEKLALLEHPSSPAPRHLDQQEKHVGKQKDSPFIARSSSAQSPWSQEEKKTRSQGKTHKVPASQSTLGLSTPGRDEKILWRGGWLTLLGATHDMALTRIFATNHKDPRPYQEPGLVRDRGSPPHQPHRGLPSTFSFLTVVPAPNLHQLGHHQPPTMINSNLSCCKGHGCHLRSVLR